MARTATSWACGIGCALASAGLACALVGYSVAPAPTAASLAPAEAGAAMVDISSAPAASSVAQETPIVEPTFLSALEAYQMMQQGGELVIIDARTDQEYADGHIPDAVLLPYDLVDAHTAAAVVPTSDTPVLVYCRSGRRSELAARSLAELGYTHVFDFGGIESWPYAVVSGSASDPAAPHATSLRAVNPPSYEHMAYLVQE